MPSTPSFGDLGLPTALQRVLADRDITVPTPIQAATLADALAGRDVLGRGRTGSGKTYAFLLPLVARLAESRNRRQPRRPRALILAPTRELARQIETALHPLGATAGLTSVSVVGGAAMRPQINALRNGVDVVVACPGRLEDLIRQGACSLDAVEITVLDEADHMADLGFLPAVTRLLDQTRSGGQRLLFSATLDTAVAGLVRRYLSDPARHEADSPDDAHPLLAHHVLHLPIGQHFPVLSDLAAAPGKKVIFTRTKRRAKTITRQLNEAGVAAVELHADLSQGARVRSLRDFQSGRVDTLVATDIAARGIHVDDVALVVHADPPADPKAYVHRSGRTARAGQAGVVVTLTTDAQLRDLRRLTKAAGVSPVTTRVDSVGHPVLSELAPGERLRVVPSLEPSPEPARPLQAVSRRPEQRRSAPPRRGAGATGNERGRSEPRRGTGAAGNAAAADRPGARTRSTAGAPRRAPQAAAPSGARRRRRAA